MPIGLVRTAWAGTSGGPGVTQLFIGSGNGFTEFTPAQAQSAVNAVRTFFSAIAANLPDELVLTTSPVVDQYDIPSGQLVGSVSAGTAPTSVPGTNSGAYFMAAGVKLNLNTSTVRNGRRVRGGIYIVPCSAGVMSATGTVASVSRTAFNTAGAQLISALGTAGLTLLVYSRPLSADEKYGPRSGAVANVTGIETNEKGAVLRGRRD